MLTCPPPSSVYAKLSELAAATQYNMEKSSLLRTRRTTHQLECHGLLVESLHVGQATLHLRLDVALISS